MSVANLVIFLIVVAALALLVAQNLSPSLSLVFLGSQSPAFPLSFWIVTAIALGVILSLLIWGLFQLSGAGAAPASSPRPSQKPPVRPTDFSPEPPEEPEPPFRGFQNPFNTNRSAAGSYSPEPTPSPASRASDSDDWETEVKPIGESWDEEDWGLEEDEPVVNSSVNSGAASAGWVQEEPPANASETKSSKTPEPEPPRRDNYEVEQQPKRQSWSGSVYSYGYRDSGDSGAGKSESVYDADYRVITPPPPPTEIQNEGENWEVENGGDEESWEESSSGSPDESSPDERSQGDGDWERPRES